MTNTVYNFCAGPAMLPAEVLATAQQELLDWNGTGHSVMEVSHRSPEFQAIVESSEQDLRELLSIPDNYHVLFMQGGATAQFSLIPLNLLGDKTTADYVDTGIWSTKAISQASTYCEPKVVASSRAQQYTMIPGFDSWQLNSDAAYLHYTPNETINGVEFHWVPQADVPLVADMSSTILSRPIDVSKFGMIYAGAQKNIGPSGIALIIIRDDLLGKAHPMTPELFNFEALAKQHSLINTPPTFAWYLAALTFKWLLKEGGVEAMAKRNQQKASKLYAAIDDSEFYANPIQPECRSWMNVPFTLKDASLNNKFLTEAKANGLVALEGHRSVGGMRASLYNAMPEAGVDALIGFMQGFEKHSMVNS